MIKVIKSINKWIIINTEIREQKFTKDYKFFDEYKKYEFDTIEDFIINYVYEKIDKGTMRTLKNKAMKEDEKKEKQKNLKRKKDGYKKKLRKEEKEKTIKELQEKHPDLKYSEIIKIAIAKVDNKVNWKFYIRLTEKEKKSLKRKMILKKKDIKQFIQDIDLEEDEFETIKQVYNYVAGEVNFRNYLDIKYLIGDCPLIKGYKSVVNKYDDFYKIMSFNPKKREGIILNIWDLFDLYNINVFDFIRIKNLKVKEVEEYNEKMKILKKEKKRYDKVIKQIDCMNNKNPEIYKYLKKHLDTLKLIITEGKNNICSTKYLREDNKAIFFASVRYLEKNCKIKFQTISKKINLFCVLGILSKEFNPKNMNYDNNYSYDINYLVLNDIDWKEVKKRIDILKENKITLRDVSFKTISEILGQELAENIFQKRKAKEKKIDNENSSNIIYFDFKSYNQSNSSINKSDNIEVNKDPKKYKMPF